MVTVTVRLRAHIKWHFPATHVWERQERQSEGYFLGATMLSRSTTATRVTQTPERFHRDVCLKTRVRAARVGVGARTLF